MDSTIWTIPFGLYHLDSTSKFTLNRWSTVPALHYWVWNTTKWAIHTKLLTASQKIMTNGKKKTQKIPSVYRELWSVRWDAEACRFATYLAVSTPNIIIYRLFECKSKQRPHHFFGFETTERVTGHVSCHLKQSSTTWLYFIVYTLYFT